MFLGAPNHSSIENEISIQKRAYFAEYKVLVATKHSCIVTGKKQTKCTGDKFTSQSKTKVGA